MLEDIKIAFFDLDGTLLDANKNISDSILRSLNKLKNKGITIVLASGRPFAFVKKYADMIGGIDYFIANNGTVIYHNDNLLFKEEMNKETVSLLWNYAHQNNLGIILDTEKERLVSQNNQYQLKSEYEIIDELPLNRNIYQVTFTNQDPSKIAELLNYLKDIEVKISYVSNSYFVNEKNKFISVDVNKEDISKGTAILQVLDHLNLAKENSICFGDNINDLEMFDNSEIKVAMDTSPTILSSNATYITNDISHFINEYLI